MRTVYLDYNSTTPLSPRVFEAMRPYFTERFGNPSSAYHTWGRAAAQSVSGARDQIAALLECNSSEIVFTGCATESNNIAIQGLALSSNQTAPRPHFITTQIEHKSVLDVMKQLEKLGAIEVSYIAPDIHGLVTWPKIEAELKPTTRLISIIAANNEIGTLNPIETIGNECKKRDLLFHTDATQWIGKLPFSLNKINVDLVSASAHKFYGPQGVGLLYVRKSSAGKLLKAITWGGGQERGYRSGTHNVAGIVGCGTAAQMANESLAVDLDHARKLNQLFLSKLLEYDGVSLNGHSTLRLPHNINLCFDGVSAESLMNKVPHIAMSSGSACLSAVGAPSHVLAAIGLSPEKIGSSIRISFGRGLSEDDIKFAASEICAAYLKLRN